MIEVKTRKQYIDGLDKKKAAEYICRAYKSNRYKISKALMAVEDMREWLSAIVDEEGNEVI